MDSGIRVYWTRIDEEVRRAIVVAGILVGTILFVGGARYFVLGGINETAVTGLTPADQIIQAIKGNRLLSGTPNLGDTANNRDYQPTNLMFFGNNTWIVADIPPRSPGDQQLAVIMRQDGSNYVLAMGPGTDFPSDTLQKIGAPPELISFLEEQGMVSTIGG